MRKVITLHCRSKNRVEGGRFNYEFVHQNGSPEIHTSLLASTAHALFNNNIKVGSQIHVFVDEVSGQNNEKPLITVDPTKITQDKAS